jgi:hypothetical protein
MGGEQEQAGGTSRPRSALFDPVASARMLAEIQAEGLRAAGTLIDRIVAAVDAQQPSKSNGTRAETSTRPSPSDTGRFIDAWIDILQRFSASEASSANGRARAETAREVRLGGGAPGEPLRLEVEARGAIRSGPGEIWLHNGNAAATGSITLHCSKLRSPDGERLAAALRFEPADIDSLPGRSSRGFALHVIPKRDLTAGRYRGVIQARGAPEVWMAVEVVVLGEERK